MGDFNVNLMNYQTNNLTGEFLDIMYSNLLCPMINRPTRITSHTATLIDNILTNNIDADSVNGLLFSDISDHLPIFSISFDDKSNSCTNDRFINLFRDKRESNVNKFKEKIASYDWSEINNCSDPTEAYNKFSSDFSRTFNECFPLKKKSTKKRIHKPWISNAILKSIKTKNKLYKQFVQHPDTSRELKYKSYKNKLVRLIRIAKQIYYDKKIEENKTNMKQTFKYLNEIINKNKNRRNSVFTHDNQDISDPQEIANRFCHYFSNIGPNLAKKIPSSQSTTPESYLTKQFLSTLTLDPVTESEIIEITKEFHSGKAAGYDNIPMSIIQETITIIARPLSHIINLTFLSGTVPDQLKISRVIPLFKTGNQANFSNYRPVSVLPAFSKIIERTFYSRLANYLSEFDILCKNQYGFRKGYSTSFALIDMYDKISAALDNKEFAVGFFYGFVKSI